MDEFDPFHIFNCSSDHGGLECPKRTVCFDHKINYKNNRKYKVDLTTDTNVLVKLYHKYEHLQQLYYSLYLESFSDASFKVENHQVCNFFELYKNFKQVCNSLNKVKNNQYLIKEEIRILLKHKDVKKFLVSNKR